MSWRAPRADCGGQRDRSFLHLREQPAFRRNRRKWRCRLVARINRSAAGSSIVGIWPKADTALVRAHVRYLTRNGHWWRTGNFLPFIPPAPPPCACPHTHARGRRDKPYSRSPRGLGSPAIAADGPQTQELLCANVVLQGVKSAKFKDLFEVAKCDDLPLQIKDALFSKRLEDPIDMHNA